MHKNLRNAIVAFVITMLLAPLAATAAASGTVNLNTANAQQLQLLPRIGPSVAQRIVDYRKENGGKFATLDDLMLVRGVGESTFAQLKPYVTLGGETTLKEKVKSGRASATKHAGKPAAPAKQQG
jgi:competence ComEA-like helix-hairpin-helix protein